MRKRQGRRGSILVEFSLAGIASMCLLITTVSLGIGMWNYHTLAYAVHECTRFAAVKGHNCTLPGNSCSVTVATIAQKFASVGVGVPPGQVNVTLTTQSGAVTSCVPLSSCYTNSATWPPSSNSDNKVGNNITISAAYQFRSVMLFFWPGKGSQQVGTIWLPATSTQPILF